MQLKAAGRLLAVSKGRRSIEAQLNKTKNSELRAIQKKLNEERLIFAFVQPYLLLHNTGPDDIAKEAEMVATMLNDLGYELKILPGIYLKSTFALKGNDGIILQKISPKVLRIFFSI